MERISDLREQLSDLLNSKPETGAQWAQICLIEKLLIEAEQQNDDGQFGVGA